MKFIFKKKIQNRKGFTLIELVIAIFIISMAIVGIGNAFYVVTNLTSDVTDRLTATYLAQEGIEMIRNIRDTNWLQMDEWYIKNGYSGTNPNSWNDGFVYCSSGCEVDYTTEDSNLASWGTSGRFLKINSDGFYNYTNGVDSKFKRKILITEINDIIIDDRPNHIMKVRIEVSWNSRGTLLDPAFAAGSCQDGKNCIVVEETLYNWYFPNH